MGVTQGSSQYVVELAVRAAQLVLSPATQGVENLGIGPKEEGDASHSLEHDQKRPTSVSAE